MITDAELVERLVGVFIDGDNKEFFRGWLDHQLLLNRCTDCGTWHHPPKPVCPTCWSGHLVPTAVSGRGTVYMVIWLRQGPPAEGVDYSTPHPVVTVELVEQPGLRFTSTVIGAVMSDIAVGDSVALAWIKRNGEPYPVFTHLSADAVVAAKSS